MQRRPDSSLRPNHSEARRCGQNSSTRPMRPWLSRKPTRRSPSSRTRTGGHSGSGNSRARNAGIQYLRKTLPIGVPGPVLVTSSLSSRVSMGGFLSSNDRPDRDNRPIARREQERADNRACASHPVCDRKRQTRREGRKMNVIFRPGTPEDAAACGAICFEAFKSIASEHNFPWDFPSVEVATGLMRTLLAHPGFYSVVAEADGKVVGSNFLDERSLIAGIGPITVDPASQNQTIGRRLMLDVLERCTARGVLGVRLLQSAYHNRSLCLYTKLGFETRETVSKLNGAPLGISLPGYAVRPAVKADLSACNALCQRVHGHHRGGELEDAIEQGSARVVEHVGAISAYCTDIAFFAHAVAESNQGMKALIGAAPAFSGGGFLAPTGNGELFRWCLQNGLRLVHQMTLMTIGLYNEPAGAYLPSVIY